MVIKTPVEAKKSISNRCSSSIVVEAVGQSLDEIVHD
jgi:hypothetical protein